MTDRRESYLPDQRLLIFHVDKDLVDATVIGDRESHRVAWLPDTGWMCSCPAKTTHCGHIAAVRTIVVLYAVSDDAALNATDLAPELEASPQ